MRNSLSLSHLWQHADRVAVRELGLSLQTESTWTWEAPWGGQRRCAPLADYQSGIAE